MKLFDYTQSANARRVRIFLAEKGISVPSTQVDIAFGENLRPEYLQANPRGLVPALELDDGSVIDESVAICRYFERLHPEPNLMGREPEEEARIESWERRCERDGLNAVALAFREVSPVFVDRAAPGNVGSFTQIPALADRSRELVIQFLKALDTHLRTSRFVAGPRFTIADITAMIAIGFGKWVDIRIGSEMSSLSAWYETVRARPSASA